MSLSYLVNTFFFILKFIYLFIWLHHTACGILVPPIGIEPGPSAVGAQSHNYWTTREFPLVTFI